MSTSERPQIRTRVFARVLGPFLTIGPAAVIVAVVDWAAVVRGVILRTVPRTYDAAGNAFLGPGAYAALRAFFACLGPVAQYLADVGWKPALPSPQAVVRPTEGLVCRG
jgi:hypothetical protein